MARVFVSHAGGDRDLAREVFEWLPAAGHQLFFDHDLRAGLGVGEQWQDRLFERLRWADAVVCVVTSRYVKSAWCAAEVGIALSRGSRVLPVVAEAGARHPLLEGIQFADYAENRQQARAVVLEALRRLDSGGGRGWADGRSPFPGLRAFDTEMSRVFFGRHAEVQKLTALLRSPDEPGVVVVTGPSGCGKSSLVRAGLLPAIADEPDWWTLPVMRPGVDPVGALAVEMTREAARLGLSWQLPQVRFHLEGRRVAALIEELLLAAPRTGHPPRRMLLVVDQFEELLTLVGDPDRTRVAGILRDAMAGSATVVATLRPEFLAPMLANPDLGVLRPRSFLVRPLDREMLGEVIRSPAELAGITVDPELVARLVSDTGSGEALPLLAFALKEVADKSGGQELSARQYDQLGGVRGALNQQADGAMGTACAATGRSQAQVIAGLLRLVSVDETGTPVRLRVPVDDLPDVSRIELGAFTARRLLTLDTEADRTVVSVAHEAFLNAWPPLAHGVAKHGAALRSRRAVETTAAEWDAAGRPKDRLWERGQLAAAVEDLQQLVREEDHQPSATSLSPAAPLPASPRPATPRRRRHANETETLSPRARDFLVASKRTDRRRRARLSSVLVLLLVGSVVAAIVAVIQQRIAEEQRAVATARQLLAEAESVGSSNPRIAVKLSLAASALYPSPQSDATMFKYLAGSAIETSLTSPNGAVSAVAFSPDGHTLATGSGDAIILWDVTDTTRPTLLGQSVTGDNTVIQSVAFSPDGHTLATGSWHAMILWDLTDRARPTPVGDPHTGASAVRSVAFSPDGRTLATGSDDGTVILWDLTDRARPTPVGDRLTGPVSSVAFSPDGHTLATGSDDGTVILWDLTDRARPTPVGDRLTGHTGPVSSVAFSSDGHTLATGSADTTAILWDLTQRTPIGAPLTGHTIAIKSVAFSADGHTLATGSADKTVLLWDLTDRTRPTRLGPALAGHTDYIESVAFSPDGHTLATGSDDKTAILWDLTDRGRPTRLGAPLTGHTGPVSSVALSPDGHTLATGSDDKTAILWDLTDRGRPTRLGAPLTGHTGPVSSVAFSPDGHTLATGSDDKTAILWDLTDRGRPTRLGAPLTGHTGPVSSVAFSPDGHTLATGSDDATLILWDLTDPTRPKPLVPSNGGPFVVGDLHGGGPAGVSSVAFNPGGDTPVAAGSADATTNLVDPIIGGGQILTGHTGPVSSVAFSPDGHTLATGSDDKTAILWDLTDRGRPTRLGAPLTGHTGPVSSVAFSPDGHTLATGSDDKTAILWDLTDRGRPTRLGAPLTGHTGPVSSVAFSPDGHTLATGSDDATAILWDITAIADLRDHLHQRACAVTGEGLNADEWSHYVPDLPYQEVCTS